jgi:serine O-acetyltransferase
VEHDFIASHSDYRAFLAADLHAHNEQRWWPWMRITHPELHYQRVLRRVEYTTQLRTPVGRLFFVVARLRLARLSLISGISVPAGVFGRGLSIAHYGSIVVNDKVRVGKYCRIHSATNLGEQDGEAPVLGDLVYIGPGAVIYGRTVVGDRSVVGANAVVRGSFPAGVTVAGAPARVLSSTDSSAVMPAWFPSTV